MHGDSLVLLEKFKFLFRKGGVFLVLGAGLVGAAAVRPLHTDGGIVERNAALGGGVVHVGAFIGELCRVGEHQEPVGEPFGDVEHLLVLRREGHPHPFAEGGAAGAAVHRHVEYLAQRHPHQLALGVVFLEVQAPQHPPGGAALVVLHERLVDARRRELVDLIGLHKIAAVITKDRRLNDLYFGDLRPDKIELAHTACNQREKESVYKKG